MTLTAAPARVDRLLAEAHALRHTDTAEALRLCREAEAMALRLDYQHGLAYARLRSALCLGILGEAGHDAEALLLQAQSLMESLGDLAGQCEALNLRALARVARGDHAAAQDLHLRCLQLRRQAGDRVGEAGSLNNLGLLFHATAQFADALQHLFMSLEVANGVGDLRSRAYATSNIGVVLAELGDPPHALSYLLQGLELIRRTPDRAHESSLLSHLGRLLSRTGHPPEALVHLQRAHELALLTGNQGDLVLALLGQGLAQQESGHLAEAEAQLSQALALANRRGERREQAEIMLAMGRNDSLAGALPAAVRWLNEALDCLQGQKAELLSGQVCQLLSQIHEQRGDHRLALQHFQAFYACQQRIHSQDSQRRIRSLLQRAELERVQRDVEEARQRGDELAQALDEAREADRRKEELLARLSQQSELLRQLAREDGLTGLANRRWLDAQLQRERERARRHHHPLSLAMIDLDHFKSINDRFSHRVGDEVLRRLGQLLREAFRSGDVIGRYGGEEFLVLLVETPLASAVSVCEKLRERVAALVLDDLHPELRQVTVSIGLAGDLPDPMALDPVLLADQALYRAKGQGRNRVCWAPAAGEAESPTG